MLKYGLIAFLVIIQFQLALSKDFGEECCIRFPKAMDINTFQTRVATGEDWVELFVYVCPFDPPFASVVQFRTKINVTNGVLTRTVNFRNQRGEPCVGASNNSFDQVSSQRAMFRQVGADGLIREDRYMDTGHLDDYYVIFSCRDRASARRGRCFNYFVSLLVRDDPPANFPWDKALREFKKFGIAARDIILFYVDEVCPVT